MSAEEGIAPVHRRFEGLLDRARVGPAEEVQRAARLVDYHSRDVQYPGLGEVLDRLIDSSWKSVHTNRIHLEIQRVVNSEILKNLIMLDIFQLNRRYDRFIKEGGQDDKEQ